jgi:hemoglobin-like flavoprotein
MTTREFSLLKYSFQRIGPFAEQTIGLFYRRLFELDPTLREFFQCGRIGPGRGLLEMVGLAANGTARLDSLALSARHLGLRHAHAHVKGRHYDTIGEALLWMLAQRLGTDFTAEMRTAWDKIYWLLAEPMRAGARDGIAKLSRAR